MNAHATDMSCQPAALPTGRSVALLVDGENVAARHADRLIIRSRARLGALSLLRVYGDAARLGDWAAAPDYRFIQSRVAGKSVADMTLAVEAMELALTGRIDALAIASRDRDFSPLVWALRQKGLPVLILTPQDSGLAACMAAGCLVEQLSKPEASRAAPKPSTPSPKPPPQPQTRDPFIRALRAELANGPLTLSALGSRLNSQGVTRPPGKLSTWLRAHPELCRVTGEGATLTAHPPGS